MNEISQDYFLVSLLVICVIAMYSISSRKFFKRTRTRPKNREMMLNEIRGFLNKQNSKIHELNVMMFNIVEERVEFHEEHENNKIDDYHNFWKWLLIITPILSLISTVELGIQQYSGVTQSTPPIISLVLGTIVTILSASISAILPAKRFSEAANNMIRLDEIIFNTFIDIHNENIFPLDENKESERARFWKEKNKEISEIGRAMISEDLVADSLTTKDTKQVPAKSW